MITVVLTAGERVHRNNPKRAAEEWEIGAGMTPLEARAWIDAGVWNATTARDLQVMHLVRPADLAVLADYNGKTVSGDLVEDVCNGDMRMHVLLDVLERRGVRVLR